MSYIIVECEAAHIFYAGPSSGPHPDPLPKGEGERQVQIENMEPTAQECNVPGLKRKPCSACTDKDEG